MDHGGERIQRVSRRQPCPICGRKKWCGFTSEFVICTKLGEGDIPLTPARWVKRTANHANLWIPEGWARYAPPPAPPPAPSHQAAPLERRARVYDQLVRLLPLTAEHREEMARRGLADPAALERLCYRSLPLQGRYQVAQTIVERLGEEAVVGVPGFYFKEGHHGTYPTLACPPGMLIPARTRDGRIQGFQIRLDHRDPELGKYIWFTSDGRPGGASSGAPLHWAIPRPEAVERSLKVTTPSRLETLVRAFRGSRPERQVTVVTEGLLKSDLTAEFLGVPVLGLGGVSLWPRAVEEIRAHGAGLVVVAFDADAAENKDVREARDGLARALIEANIPVLVAVWPLQAGKGIDDVLAAGNAHQVSLYVTTEFAA